MEVNTPYIRDGKLDAALRKAISVVQNLIEQGAPRPVLAAANHMVDCYKCGVPAHQWAKDVILKYTDSN